MALWWIGNIVFLVVVIPVVVLLLRRLLEPVQQIGAATDQILTGGVNIAANLDAVPQLVTTRDLVTQVGGAVGAYGAQLDKIL